jgi:hypothetical protein
MVDVVILGATEVDVDFNANVVTHSDGYLLHGIGGWQNCLFSKTVILPIPLFRDRIPVVVDEVTTLCGPGELIDVIVTERGIAINPLRKDLIKTTENSGLPIKTLQELKDEAERICGKPEKPQLDKEVVAAIKWGRWYGDRCSEESNNARRQELENRRYSSVFKLRSSSQKYIIHEKNNSSHARRWNWPGGFGRSNKGN